MDLVIPTETLDMLSRDFFQTDLESCAVLLTSVVRRADGTARALVQDVLHVSSDAYQTRTPVAAELSPLFVLRASRLAQERAKALVFVHSHPTDRGTPRFSGIDDRGEQLLRGFLRRRQPDMPSFALLMSPGGAVARELGTTAPVSIVEVGPTVRFHRRGEVSRPGGSLEAFDRQVRAFGVDGQRLLRDARVAVVGLGGTGSLVVQQLAYLGVSKFDLFDFDTIDTSNLNRLAGAYPSDVGAFKVDAIARHVRTIRPDAQVEQRRADVLSVSTARAVADADFIFCCTDSHGSRAIINQLAYQYLVPCIDMGVVIVVGVDGAVSRVAGRVQMLAPGLACLTCSLVLDPEAVRRDFLTPAQRAADPYILGEAPAQPAVISLNSTVSSLAVTMFMAALVGVPSGTRHQIYDGVAGTVRSVLATPDPTCIVCSRTGALARGDEWPLPGRPS